MTDNIWNQKIKAVKLRALSLSALVVTAVGLLFDLDTLAAIANCTGATLLFVCVFWFPVAVIWFDHFSREIGIRGSDDS